VFPGDPALVADTTFLTACLNGGTSRDEHPAVPFSPEELAAEARSAAASGARAIHVHPRSAAGAQSLAPSDVLPAVAAIRAATGLPVGVTTGIWAVSGDTVSGDTVSGDTVSGDTVSGDTVSRARVSRDTVSRATVSRATARRLALVAGWTGPDKPDFASVNVNEPGIDALADLLIESLGIPVEAGVWTVADVDLLAGSTLASRAFQVLLEPTSRVASEAVAVASAASVALLERGIAVPQVHHGYGLATWDVIRWAAGAGFRVRIGLEDTTVLPDGAVAAGNGDLVAAAMRLAAEAGR
jgi:uncharacterized protein (DUF849 family)